jgi:signal transduction histidine kinase
VNDLLFLDDFMSASAAPNELNGSARILLVDDEVRNLDALECLLSSSEYSLVRALSAEVALRELLEHDFAAILMDVRMPTMSGVELARLIKQRERSQGVPIIFLTAQALDKAEVLLGYEAGAVDYLTKPVDGKILQTKISVFVDLFKKKNELARAEESLRMVNAELEMRVLERTEKLTQANSELAQAHGEVVAASRAKDDFLAALSHELRTPLNPVLLIASDAAEDHELSAEVRAKFSTIRNNVELEARLIDDLLDITRISHGKLSLNLEEKEVHSILQAAVETVRSDFIEKRIALELRLADADLRLTADETRLQQVFWNILKNANKFTPNGGKVHIATGVCPDRQRMWIRITDSGIGLTSREIDSIFNAFSQGEHARKGGVHRFGGLGLGLTISRMLVELHAGSIQAASEGRGKGATFTVELPLLPVDAKTHAHIFPPANDALQNVAAKDPARLGFRILVVEDHEPTRLALTQLLSRRQHVIFPAKSLIEARHTASREKLDLVISDIGLPDGDGYTLMAELSKNFGLNGIALTGYGMEHDVVRAKKAGFTNHLIKPVRIERLDQILKTYVKEIHRENREGQTH